MSERVWRERGRKTERWVIGREREGGRLRD